MKSKKLIEELQRIDPSGEMEVCVHNEDIYFIEKQPAYYDGGFQVLIKDGDNIKGIKYVIDGSKIKLHLFDLEYRIIDDPDFPVEIPDAGNYLTKCFKERVENFRKESKEINKEIKNED